MTHPRSHALAAAAATLLIILVGPASVQAQQRYSDVVVLTNGDRITGEIKGLSRGRLSFDVKPVGVISINWAYVAELTSALLFEVETNTGERMLGTLSRVGRGKLTVATLGGPVAFDLPTVVEIAPIGRSFFKRLDGSISLGGSYTQASGVAQLTFALDVKARRPSFEWRVNVDDYVTLETEGGTSERFSGSVGYSRDITGRWAVFGGGQIERNPDLGFDFRATVGGGMERTLLRSNRSSMVIGAGLAGSQEVPLDAPGETLVQGLFTFRHSYFTYTTPKTSLDTTFNAYPILNQWGRWRVEANTSLSREIVKNFSVAVSLYESFDNRPPSAEASRNDAGATLSIAFTF